MKLRFLATLFTLAAVVFLAIACGGGDDNKSSTTPTKVGTTSAASTDPLKDYFQQLSTILTRVDDRSTQLTNQYPSAGDDPDQTRQYIAQFLPDETSALSDIKNLDAPDAVKDLHDKLVSAIEDVLAADTSLSNDVQDISSASDMKAYFDSHRSAINAKIDQVNVACSDLQTKAQNSGILVDLRCTKSNSAATPAPPAAH